MASQKNNLLDILPLSLLLGLWAFFHYRVLFLGQTFVLEDSSRFFFPLWKWGAGVWDQGLIPLWNPDAGFGTPYLADPQMGAWYFPLFLLYRVFTPVTAFNLLIVGHHLLGLGGFYLFARSRKISPWVALAGSLVFGFSFNAISLSWATPMLFAYAWIPWIFWAADGLRDGRKGSFLRLGFFLAMQLAAGYPVFFYLTLFTLFIDWMLRKVPGPRPVNPRWKTELGLGLAAFLLALSYNSAWLLPFKEFMPLSSIGGRLGFWEALRWDDLATFLNPFFKGHPLHSHPPAPYSVTVYFAGLPPLVFLLWGLWSGKISKPSSLLFVLLTLLSLGETAFLGGWLKDIWPGYGFVVRSGYWIPLLVFVLANLFMEAASARLDGTGKKDRRWLAAVCLIFGMALALGVPWDLWTFWAAFLLTLLVGSEADWPKAYRKILLLLALVFSLAPVAWSFNFTMDKAYYETEPELCTSLTRPGRIYHSVDTINRLQTVSGKSVLDVYDQLKEFMAPNWPLGEGREEVVFENALFLKSMFLIEGDFWNADKMACLDIRYFIGGKPEGKTGLAEIPGAPMGFWENKQAASKWYAVEKAKEVGPQKDWKSVFGNPFLDLRKECCVLNPSLAGNYGLRQVKEVSRTPSEVVLEADGKGRALLASSETAYPGWQAEVDGKPRKLEVVNHVFRGVILEPGETNLKMEFRPTTFRLGCFLSLLVCGFWAGMFLNSRREPSLA
jgi:hypothetical protein